MILDREPVPVFRHLKRMTDDCGLFEHADHATPRPEHGYCVDDNARALVVVCREPRPAPNVTGLTRRYQEFVLSALAPDGRCRNRMSVERIWTDDAGLGDWWGRALWGLATAAVSAETSALQTNAMAGFRLAAGQRSPERHAMAFAGLGAAEILRRQPDDAVAAALLGDTVDALWWDEDLGDPTWVWPEPRLRYANAAMAEAMLLGGDLLSRGAALSRGLEMLAFLLELETRDGHLSVTPVGGRGPGDAPSTGDQQPVEVAALADACATAYRITHEQRYLDGVTMAWNWFLGDNDAGVPMFDPETGAGFDGLEADGRNENQGAESTLAVLSTAQLARRLLTTRR